MRDDVSLNVIKDYADFHSKGLIVTFHKINFLHISFNQQIYSMPVGSSQVICRLSGSPFAKVRGNQESQKD